MSTRETLRSTGARGPSMTPPEARPSLSAQDIVRGIVVSVIVVGAGIALGSFTFKELNERGTAYFILAAALGIVLSVVTYRKLELVMLTYVAVAWAAVGATPDVATGATSGTGKGLTLSFVGMAFLLFFWVLRGMTGRGFSFVRLPLNKLLVLYLAFNVLCAVNGRLFWNADVAHFYDGFGGSDGGITPLPVVIFELVIRLFSVAAFWLFANNLSNEAWLRRASWLVMFPGFVSLFGNLGLLPVPATSWSTITEFILACTLFAWLLQAPLPGVPVRRGLRALGWLLLLVIFFQTFVIDLHWVSGYFGLIMGIYTVAFLHSRRVFARMLVVGLVFYVAAHSLISEAVHKVTSSSDMDRFSLAKGALLYALHFPLGIGPGNYRAYNIYYGSPNVWNTTMYSSDHNFYAQMLSETGFIGLIIILICVVTTLLTLSRFYRALPPGFSRTFVLGACGMWAGICASTYLGDYLIPVYYNGALASFGATIYAWIVLGIAFAHARAHGLLAGEQAPETVPDPVMPSAADYYPRRLSRDV